MARRRTIPDPKEAALAEARCLNPHPEQVTDPGFLASDFFEPATRCRSSTRWCARSGPRRPGHRGGRGVRLLPARLLPGSSRAGTLRAGRAGSCPARTAGTSSPGRSSPGPRNSWPPTPACARRSCRTGSSRPSACACTPARSSERWPATGSATPKAADLPNREQRKEEPPSLSLRPSPGQAAAEPGARPDAGQVTAPGGGLDARYEHLRHAALHARAQAFPPGLGVLTGKGVTAWQRALTVPQPAPPARLAAVPGQAGRLPAPVAAELISALAALALAGTDQPSPPALTRGDLPG